MINPLFDEFSHPLDYLTRSLGLLFDDLECGPQLAQIRVVAVNSAPDGTATADDGREWLIDSVGDAGGHLAQHT